MTTGRMWFLNDTCSSNRWQNLKVKLFADDEVNPGTLIASSDAPWLTASGGNTALELTFNPGSALIEELVLAPRITFPTSADPVVLFSASVGSKVGDLLGLDNVVHTVRVEGTSTEGSFAAPLTFTVVLDSDIDGLIDDWEEMFGVLGDFSTGADSDADGLNDDGEFIRGLDPSDDDGLLDGVETNTGEFLNARNIGTNPLEKDSDGDGLDDNLEDNGGVFVSVEMTGTNANNPDNASPTPEGILTSSWRGNWSVDWGSDLDDSYPADGNDSMIYTFPMALIGNPAPGRVFFLVER